MSLSEADAVSLYDILHAGIIVELVASVIFFIDFFSTFPREVKCIWQRRFSEITVLFMLNRYAVMSSRVVRIIQLKSWKGFDILHADYLCTIAWRWSEICTILMYLCIAGFAALQAYAIYRKDKRIVWLVSIIGAINPIAAIYYDTTISLWSNSPPFTGCVQICARGESFEHNLFIIGCALTITSETVAFALMWRRFAGNLSALKALNTKTSATTLLWRDGTIYFVTLIVLTTLSLLSSIFDSAQSLSVPALTDTLASMCLSNYILHLRATGLAGDTPPTSLRLCRIPATQPGDMERN